MKSKKTPEQREKQRRVNFLNAIRKAYIFSNSFKEVYEKAKVGNKYRCSLCGKLFSKNNTNIDHYPAPVTPYDKRQYQMEEMEIVERIIFAEVRCLCIDCHSKETKEQKKLRTRSK